MDTNGQATATGDPAHMARVARALADETRLRILLALLDGEVTVSDLVVRLGLPQPRVSSHLAALRRAGVVHGARDGRQRTYRVDAVPVCGLLDALAALSVRTEPPARRAAAARVVRDDTPIRRARSCYDHLAGVAGVGLLDGMLGRNWLADAPGARPAFTLTEDGAAALARRGVDLDAAARSRRLFAPGCLDWTERRPHLGGALGAAVFAALVTDGTVEREPGDRALRLSVPIDAWLDERETTRPRPPRQQPPVPVPS